MLLADSLDKSLISSWCPDIAYLVGAEGRYLCRGFPLFPHHSQIHLLQMPLGWGLHLDDHTAQFPGLHINLLEASGSSQNVEEVPVFHPVYSCPGQIFPLFIR